jgi:TolB-like protein/AraC-like DNA-binding protein/Tfp pilus assembly protein PilF
MASTQKRENNFLAKLTEIVRSNLENEQFGVSELAREMGMSRSNLHRKVRAETGKSISLFIRHLRLEAAIRLLRQTSLTASEVAFKCGFHSVSYFTRCFHEQYGYPPGQASKIEEEDLDTDNIQVQDTGPRSKNKKIFIFLISAISVVIIACIIIFILVQPFSSGSKPLEKSIAILPFINDSPEKTDTYFIDGTMESILDNLCKIKDLRVIPRTSVMQYRENPKPASEIARELNVSYILEGSGQKYGNNIRLTLQLIDAVHEKHIWSHEYDREISKIEEYFALQSEIALLVADEIKATVTSEEKQRIEKIQTRSPTAFDFLQRAWHEQVRYEAYHDQEALVKSKRLYHLALEYDSTLAAAWTGLSVLYSDEHFVETYLSEDFMDSALILANIALSYDDQIPAGYIVRGVYSYLTSGGRIKEALNNYEKALRFNPNDWSIYQAMSDLYMYSDYVKSIEYLQKSASLNPGLQLPGVLKKIGWRFFGAGCTEEAKQYIRQAFLLDNDTATYCLNLGSFEYCLDNYERAIEYGIKALETDSSLLDGQILLAICYRSIGQYEVSLKYFQKSLDRYSLDELGYYYPFDWAGQVYSVNGYREQADQYFNKQIDIANRAIELGRPRLTWNLIPAGVYAYRGDRNEAYRYLNMYNQKCEAVDLTILAFIKNDPLFDNIRDEPEFQRLMGDFEAKYQAQHDKVRKWLDEQGGP